MTISVVVPAVLTKKNRFHCFIKRWKRVWWRWMLLYFYKWWLFRFGTLSFFESYMLQISNVHYLSFFSKFRKSCTGCWVEAASGEYDGHGRRFAGPSELLMNEVMPEETAGFRLCLNETATRDGNQLMGSFALDVL